MYYDGLLYLSLCLKLSWTFLASVVLLVSALRFSLFRLFTNDILLWLTRLPTLGILYSYKRQQSFLFCANFRKSLANKSNVIPLCIILL